MKHNKILLQVRPGSDAVKKQSLLENWYRATLKQAIPPLITRWEPLMGVKVERFFAQRMKTKWRSCNPATRNIRLNTDLAKKPPEYLEYIVVHEMAHLLEPTHSSHFKALMDLFMPKWLFYRAELNRLPVRHEEWADAKPSTPFLRQSPNSL